MLTKCIRPLASRGFSTTNSQQQSRSLVKFKKLQADFQCEDGRPIYLKTGLMDRVLYSSTLVGCVLGVAGTLEFVYDKAKPPSWKGSVC